jgi:RyR domain-containing protein
VIKGAEVALKEVPLGQFGKLLTVDRREIESLRNIRALVGEYCRHGKQERPLSVAVFGAPGSGKSFGITEVAKSLLPGQIEVRQYNLSQFSDRENLLDAMHQVRDIGLSGLIPLVFWDEFDTSLNGQPLGWLRHFLAPMQDGNFQEGQVTHSIGRSIFVFAGGIYESMETFGQKKLTAEQFQEAKGPDFVSRLKGYVNVMGPNRQKDTGGKNAIGDPYYIIRRAILLRSILLRYADQLFNEEKELNIDSGVLRALLYTDEYKHGVRSMESVVAMSLLSGKIRFERSCLPAAAQLDLHVDAADFQALVQRIELDDNLARELAGLIHEKFRQRLINERYEPGPRTDDKRKLHSSLVPYEELPEEEKRQNIANAQDIPNKLAQVGYIMLRARSEEEPIEFPPCIVERLAEMEHERWLKAKLEAGWRWASETDKDKNLHKDLLPWRKLSKKQMKKLYTREGVKALGARELPDKEKEKDRDLVRSIPWLLQKVGYTIIKI